MDAGSGELNSNKIGIPELPECPGDKDWGLKLIYKCPAKDKNIYVTFLYFFRLSISFQNFFNLRKFVWSK